MGCSGSKDAPKERGAESAAAGGGGRDARASPATALHKEALAAAQNDSRVQAGSEHFAGPGPAADFEVEEMFGCFDEGNGLLFRLVSNRRHMWAYYNDTSDYVMRVSVVFGNESMVRPQGSATQVVLNAETGQCRVEVVVRPGETQPFMRGEYNGFTSTYDAVPTYLEEEEGARATGKAVRAK